jgi:hypothetical protein
MMKRSGIVGWAALALGCCFYGCAESARFAALTPAPCAAPVADFDVAGLNAGMPSFASTDVNLIPSNYTPPDAPSPGGEVASPGNRPTGAAGTWRRSGLVPHTTRLAVGDTEALPLESTRVLARIDGFRARVVLDLVFRNDRDRTLEGFFLLRLPDGASPHHLAFGETTLAKPELTGALPSHAPASVRGSRPTSEKPLREARMVPREKAAFAYGETVRKEIDPALLEWSGAGTFSARVFPLTPKTLHRITVGYDVSLLSVGEDLVYRLDLPEAAGDVEIDLDVGETEAEVTPVSAAQDGHHRWKNPSARTFVARLPRHGAVLLASGGSASEAFVAARFRPELPEAPAPVRERAVFLVDVSLSANPDRFPVWRALLRSILERNRPDLREVAVAFFNVETFWWKDGFQPNTAATVEALTAFADGLVLEGATDLGQALAAARSLPGDYDVFLLSDGAATWGEGDPHALAAELGAGHAVFAYATGTGGTDVATLAHLTRATGGAVFAVPSESAVAAAATAHRRRPWRLKEVALDGVEDVLLAGRPVALYPGQVLDLVGRGRPTDDAAVHLTVEQGDATLRVEVPLARRIPSELATRTYGEVAVAQLEELDDPAGPARAYATHFRVVGRTCSLLLLETEADYERHGIRPAEDTRVVRQELASSVVASRRAAVEGSLGDPKRRFLAWLERLRGAAGVDLKLPPEVLRALRDLPDESFRARPLALDCRLRERRAVPADVVRALADGTLAYDAAFAEAARRKEAAGAADAIRALSSLVESDPGDLALARDVAFTALEWGRPDQAYGLLRRVAQARPHERPTWHAMALALEDMGRIDLALATYETALAFEAPADLYGEIGQVLAFDHLRLLRRVERGAVGAASPVARARRAALAGRVPVQEADLVIVMSWNTDRTDVDLHVTDPLGEEAFYRHRDTKIGGHLTRDVTTGFGPEMFVLPRAVPGPYVAVAHYFSADRSRASGRSKAYVTVFEDWGRPDERVTRRTVRLDATNAKQEIATVRRVPPR